MRTTKLLLFSLHSGEAFAAINGSVVAGLERNLCFLAAVCAGRGEKFSGCSAGVLLCNAASLASLRLVLKALLFEEFLFACREDKFLTAVLAD